jgi:hypothetical protein
MSLVGIEHPKDVANDICAAPDRRMSIDPNDR